MMGLHQNYPVAWGPERMEGLTLDLGLDGMFSPLPPDLNVVSKELESWRFFGQSQTQQNADHSNDDPSFMLQTNCEADKKPDIFDLSLSNPPMHQQRLINMKVEREDVEPNPTTIVPPLPTDLTSETEGSRSCWRNIDFPRKELQLYGGVRDGNSKEGFPVTMAQFREVKPDRFASTSALAGHQQDDPILLDGDTDDELFLEEGDSEEDDIFPTPCRDGSGGQGYPTGSLPLRQIKQQVRLGKTEEEYAPPSTPEAMRYVESKDLEAGETNEAGEQGKTHSKRLRGYGDRDWLPSDLLLDSSKDERRIESKRARGSSELDQPCRPPVDANTQISETSEQVQIQRPQIDVNKTFREMPQGNHAFQEMPQGNQAIREMPSVTADAFKELFRLVEGFGDRASRGFDEMEGMRSATNDIQHHTPPPTTVQPSVFAQCPSEFAQGPCNPSEYATRSPCSPHPDIHEQPSGKGGSHADVVLYEPKPEPVESWRENTFGSVVQVKPEIQAYQNVPDVVSIRPAEAGDVGPYLSPRKLILKALYVFEQCRLQILKDPTYGQDRTSTSNDGVKTSSRLRADLKAACVMRKKGFWLNEKVRPIGEVPGVAVGDVFKYRIEMAVIGLHRAVQAGIAVVPVEHSKYGVTVASSVVIGVSDPYQDDNDMGDIVVYSGQGGLCCRTKESQDQELKRGNLALKNSYDRHLPVRLIRGHREQNNLKISYSYDGLYQIIHMDYVNGVNGKKVYKFTMQRLPGQAPLFYGVRYPTPLESQQPPAITAG